MYDYSNLSTASRVYNNTYLTGTSYSSQYIFNRLLTSTVTSGGTTLTLATNNYDAAAPADAPGVTQHDAGFGTAFLARGNVTSSVSFGTTQQMSYDITGTVVTASDSNPNHAVRHHWCRHELCGPDGDYDGQCANHRNELRRAA